MTRENIAELPLYGQAATTRTHAGTMPVKDAGGVAL
jgi:energy-converting hydrogenase Eha subunit H